MKDKIADPNMSIVPPVFYALCPLSFHLSSDVQLGLGSSM